MVGYFLAYYDVIFLPKNVQKSVVDLQVVGQPVQSASEKPQRSSVVSLVKCKPKWMEPLTYLKI